MTSSTPQRFRFGNALVLLALAGVAFWLLTLQDAWPMPSTQPTRQWGAGIATLAWLLLWVWMTRPRPHNVHTAATGNNAWLVVPASQTGFAHELAQHTLATLRTAGQSAQLCDIADLTPSQLPQTRCLFIASTTGEGDPPDAALHFVTLAKRHPTHLQGTQFAVLALGDRSYDQYCAFGHWLSDWLQQHNAQALFDLIEVDNADTGALRHWQHQLGVLLGNTDQPDWHRPCYQRWRLSARSHLNPGSQGEAAYHLILHPHTPADLRWSAGDIAEIGPRNPSAAVTHFLHQHALSGDTPVLWQGEQMPLQEALSFAQLPDTKLQESPPYDAQTWVNTLQALPHREYSIASVPADGQLELLVRWMPRPDGHPGIGSGWLCAHAPVNSDIALRIRSNPNFHTPDRHRPLILIGNGTGIAALRALIKARIAQRANNTWLLYGERSAAFDAFFGTELERWHAEGQLTHLNRVFSRDGGPQRYVQELLHLHAQQLQQWLAEGASVYVCGSREGMAPGVDAALQDILGDLAVAELRQSGRYRRDVY